MGGLNRFPGRLAIQQRVLPAYRAAFFDLLAAACDGGLSVFSGRARPREGIEAGELKLAIHAAGRNLHLLGGPFTLCVQAGLLEWLARWDPAILVVEANPRYLMTSRVVRWMKARHRPVVGWGLGVPPPSGMLADWRASRRLAFLKQFDAMITYSRRGAEEYAALGFLADRIYVAPNAAAARPRLPPPIRPPRYEGRPTVLFVGRLQARKRIDDLLRACAGLPISLQPHLVIVGDGPQRPALEALARQVYPAAEFPGAKHGERLASYFTQADLFVLPGTGGLAVQEAMSYALPVVMGVGDGTNEDLVRPGNGWRLTPPGVGQLRDLLEQALATPARLREMGIESYRIVAEEINLEKMVGVFVEVLNSVLTSPRRDSR
jgi:glycosyltransferase involved in cell wall biosynthesis